ncbi:hypothetical protein FVE85_9515 [Porphyridium purpureum]|uniref:Uncharacterized protein n=1 Tax=Porphyridium purpureum TaxID=35688 RepID=A0A5J4YK26_PORPP|nr:hypothetical protein FVE85_9515 [Porphyridium purpureum]|eukprot:POR1167..scf261_15
MGLYQYKKRPQVLVTSAFTTQRATDRRRGFQGEAASFLSDIHVASPMLEAHIAVTERASISCQAHAAILNVSACHIGKENVEALADDVRFGKIRLSKKHAKAA